MGRQLCVELGMRISINGSIFGFSIAEALISVVEPSESMMSAAELQERLVFQVLTSSPEPSITSRHCQSSMQRLTCPFLES